MRFIIIFCLTFYGLIIFIISGCTNTSGHPIVNEILSQNLRKVWEYEIEEPVCEITDESNPSLAVSQDRLLLVNRNKIHCIDISSGKKIWQKALPKRIKFCLATKDNSVFALLENSFYSINITTQEIIWSYDNPGYNTDISLRDSFKGFAIKDNKAIIISSRIISCVDINNGQLIWKKSLVKQDERFVGFGGLVIREEKILVNGFPFFYCFNVENGQEIWKSNIMSSLLSVEEAKVFIPSVPSVSNKKVFVGTHDNHKIKFYCLDIDSGDKLWQYKADRFFSFIYSGVTENKVIVPWFDRILCLTADRGRKLWEFKTSGEDEDNFIVSPPVISQGKVFVGSMKGILYCIDIIRGAKIGEFKAKSGILSSPILSKGKVFIVDKNGTVYCLDTGNPKVGGWEMFGGGPERGGYNRQEQNNNKENNQSNKSNELNRK